MGSLWNETVTCPVHPSLDGEHRVEVAVVGGGILGLTAARFLVEAGKSVAVLEARRLGAQVTGDSTGKVTAQHGLIYSDLLDRIGAEKARLYAEANQWAIGEIATFIEAKNISCDFERRRAFVGVRSADRDNRIAREAEAAGRLGLPLSGESIDSSGPSIAAAVGFDDQAQFHPRKYLAGVAEEIARGGGRLYEESPVVDVKSGRPLRVVTGRGCILADHALIATNLPFLDRGGFFARAFPRAHVAIAATIPDEHAPADMVYCVDGGVRSYRSWRGDDGTRLIAIGEGFVPGHLESVKDLARALEEEARRHWPLSEVTHRWMNEDYHSADRLPLVGKLTPLSKHVSTACGFGAWGLTNATAAARVLADQIAGRENEWSELYDPMRFRSVATRRFVRRNVHVGRHLISGSLARGERRGAAALADGEGAILETEDGKAAVHRDAAGRLHSFSPYCPHMGCLLSWNDLEATWDCSCHGSRFEAEGRMLHGPARHDMKPKPLP